VERAELPFDLRRAERLVEASPDGRAAAPLEERRVGPPDAEVEVHDGDAVRDVGQDMRRLLHPQESVGDSGGGQLHVRGELLGHTQLAWLACDQGAGRIGHDRVNPGGRRSYYPGMEEAHGSLLYVRLSSLTGSQVRLESLTYFLAGVI
jgi:hypothetical protein